MLNFLKKSGRSFSNDDKFIPERIKRNSIVSSWQLNDNTPLDDFLESHEINEPLEPRSRLSMNLYDIVADRTCLSYFIQFLEAKNALSLIKFYLDSESFKTVAEKEIASLENNNNNSYFNYGGTAFRRHHFKSISSENFDKISLNSSNFDISDSISIGSQFTNVTINCDHLMSNSSISLDEKLEEQIINENNSENLQTDTNNEESNNTNLNLHKSCHIITLKTVPELKTLCDLSLRKPLTDDEKSMLVLAENNKNIHKRLGKSLSANNFNEKISLADSENFKSNISNKEIQIRHKNVWTSIATDAVRIYRKYLVSNSPNFIDIPATILSTISLQICSQHETSICFSPETDNVNDYKHLEETEDQSDEDVDFISSKVFLEAQRYVLERLEHDYLNEFLESSFYCKYIVDILTNVHSLSISDILHSESALFYFMEYLEQQENHRGLLEFWVAAMNFRKHYLNLMKNSDENEPEDLIQNDAMILYDKYFSLQANNPLPVSSKIRSQIEENICSNNEEEICKCFDIAIKIIEIFFEKAYFQQFLSSQLFLNYLNDLRLKIPDYKYGETHFNSNRIKSNFRATSNSRHRKTLSDCSEENAKEVRRRLLSQQNSLPTTNIENSKFKTSKSADMKIDSRQLNDPDLLWKRNSRNGLIFGRVNSLGRYERDFEVNFNEEKWTLANGSYKLKNAMRKFVNLPEDKVQEEIAWQIAEMIVKDITSVTLGNDGNSDKI